MLRCLNGMCSSSSCIMQIEIKGRLVASGVPAYTSYAFTRFTRHMYHYELCQNRSGSPSSLQNLTVYLIKTHETWFDSKRSYRDVSSRIVLIHNFLMNELDWRQKRGYSLAEKRRELSIWCITGLYWIFRESASLIHQRYRKMSPKHIALGFSQNS